MNRYIPHIFAVFFCLFLNGQTIVSGDLSYPPIEYKADTLDTSKINVYYETKFVKNIDNEDKKTETISVLQIGDKYSKFLDNNQLKTDSLYFELSKLDRVRAKEINLLFANKPKWIIQVLKNKITQKNTIQDNAYETYQYEENQPNMEWKIGLEKKEIVGYLCRNATISYRGRDYTAWYAENLPFSDGPHQFGGLPGLIMELYDSKDYFHFKAIGIDKKENPIYLTEIKDTYKISREKFRKAQKSFHQNPNFQFEGKIFNGDGSSAEMKSIPYNPIEKN